MTDAEHVVDLVRVSPTRLELELLAVIDDLDGGRCLTRVLFGEHDVALALMAALDAYQKAKTP